MKNKKIAHIYAASAGNSGIYLKELSDSIGNIFDQYIVANYYYPFNDAYKIFYKYSEIVNVNYFLKKNKKVRLLVRYFELFFSLSYILFFLRKKKIDIINYSLQTDLNIEFYFLKICKVALGMSIIVTCHDISLFEMKERSNDKRKKIKQKIFELADCLLVHNLHDIQFLENQYRISKEKIVVIPFPMINLNLLHYQSSEEYYLNDVKYLFIGHIRKEKGVDLLVKAWSNISSRIPESELIIAGKVYDSSILDGLPENSRVKVIDKFLSDREYFSLIDQTHFVVLPYRNGTNSGVLSSVQSLCKPVIVSDLPMFSNNLLTNHDFFFKRGDIHDLEKRLYQCYEIQRKGKYYSLLDKKKEDLEEYRNHFKSCVRMKFVELNSYL